MEQNSFNPHAWQTHKTRAKSPKGRGNTPYPSDDNYTKVETIVQRIVEAKIDLTHEYISWRDIGFAFATEFGENGRKFFHAVSQFYRNYNNDDTDKQYDNCLRAKGKGITIATFIKKAKDAGIDIHQTTNNTSMAPKSPNISNGDFGDIGDFGDMDISLPSFYDEIKDKLPLIIRRIGDTAKTSQDADMMVLTALVIMSSCMSNVCSVYNDMVVHPHLYFFLSSMAGNGKGKMDLCRFILRPIHKELKLIYEIEMAKYQEKIRNLALNNACRDEYPEKPIRKRIFIPANSSASAFTEALDDNNGNGLIFETEGDALSDVLHKDFGDYSSVLRKAYHHESVSMKRRAENEDREIDDPKLSIVLSGTPNQIKNLISNTENGLFSRFIYYFLPMKMTWDVHFGTRGNCQQYKFEEWGETFKDFYFNVLTDDIWISFSNQQEAIFNNYFNTTLHNYYDVYGVNIVPSIHRLGLICYRMAMILTVTRLMDDDTSDQDIEELKCSDDDFSTALTIAKCLSVHMAKIYESLTNNPHSHITEVINTSKKEMFYHELPEKFDRQDFVEIADETGVPVSTAEKWVSSYIKTNLLIRVEHGQYLKTKTTS